MLGSGAWSVGTPRVFVGAGTLQSPPGSGQQPADGEGGGVMNGLVCGHAYTVLSVAELPLPADGAAGAASQLRLLQLRNPWGHGEWAGAWADGDRVWQTTTGRTVKAVIAAKLSGQFISNVGRCELWQTHC